MTDIWLVYGNPSAVDAQAASKVWDADFVGVWHLADAKDSTDNHVSMNKGGTRANGFIGPALAFNGANQYVDTKATEQLDSWTIEAFSYPMNPPASGVNPSGPLMRDNYNLQWDCMSLSFCRATSVLLNSGWIQVGLGNPSERSWHYLAATFDTHVLVAFVDGSSSGSSPRGTDTAAPVAASAKIAANPILTGFFAGTVDEVRISKIARAPDWISAQQLSMRNFGYVSFGAEQKY
jgi:hypothetical protein